MEGLFILLLVVDSKERNLPNTDGVIGGHVHKQRYCGGISLVDQLIGAK